MAIKIGYLGPAGTFTEQAAKKWGDRLGLATQLMPLPSIPQLVRGVLQGNLTYAVLPMENSIEGTVNLTIDTLIKTDINIVGEIVVKIQHCLVVKDNPALTIEKIFSHPQALAQCYDYLMKNFPHAELVETASTAQAAQIVADGPPHWAAICSGHAAQEYGLKIWAQGIQEHSGNKTRFLVVGCESLPASGRDKTSMIVALHENRPGGLYKILKLFADANINLTKIESRPTKKELGEYLFWIDCEGHRDVQPLQGVIQELSSQVALLKILGSYPKEV